MNRENKKTMIELFASKSNYGIIRELKRTSRALQFKDFKLLINPKSNRKYSTKTIAFCLNELKKNGIVKNEIVETGRRSHLGYCITPKGYFACQILEEAEKNYQKLGKEKLIQIKNN